MQRDPSIPIYPEIKKIMGYHHNQEAIVMDTYLRKKHEGRYYLVHVHEERALENDSSEADAIDAFHRIVYEQLVFCVPDMKAQEESRLHVFCIDENNDSERLRLRKLYEYPNDSLLDYEDDDYAEIKNKISDMLADVRDNFMKEKILSFRVDNNNFNAVATALHREIISDRVEFYAKFVLNEKEYSINTVVDVVELSSVFKQKLDYKTAITRFLHERFSQVIAAKLLQSPEAQNLFLPNN
jgi:hypothetical protein